MTRCEIVDQVFSVCRNTTYPVKVVFCLASCHARNYTALCTVARCKLDISAIAINHPLVLYNTLLLPLSDGNLVCPKQVPFQEMEPVPLDPNSKVVNI